MEANNHYDNLKGLQSSLEDLRSLYPMPPSTTSSKFFIDPSFKNLISSSQNLFQAQLQSLRDRLNNANANYLSSLQTITPVMAKNYLTRSYSNPNQGAGNFGINESSGTADGCGKAGSEKASFNPSAVYASEKVELEAKIRKGQDEIANLQKKFLASRS